MFNHKSALFQHRIATLVYAKICLWLWVQFEVHYYISFPLAFKVIVLCLKLRTDRIADEAHRVLRRGHRCRRPLHRQPEQHGGWRKDPMGRRVLPRHLENY